VFGYTREKGVYFYPGTCRKRKKEAHQAVMEEKGKSGSYGFGIGILLNREFYINLIK